MARKKVALVGYLFFLIILTSCSQDKPVPPKTAKTLKTLPKIFDAAFLDNFAQGWVFAFLKGERTEALHEIIGSNEGWQSLFEGDIQSAITSFEQGALLTDKTALVRSLLQRAAFYEQAYQDALRYQERFLDYRQKHASLVSPSQQLFFYLGRARLFSQEYKKAQANLNFFLQKSDEPSFRIRAEVLLGAVYYLKGEADKAEQLWEGLRQKYSEDKYYKSEWGFIQGYLGLNLKKALLSARNAWQSAQAEESPDQPYFLFNLVYLKLINGQLAEARELSKHIDWQEPEVVEQVEPELSLRFYNPLYLRCLSLLDLERARDLLEVSEELPYRDFYLGQIHLIKHEYPLSRQAFEAFLESKPPLNLASSILSPYNTENDFLIQARFYLGELHYLEQRTTQARQIWENTFSTNKNNPLVWLLKSEVEARYLGQGATAIKTAQTALDSANQLEAALKNKWVGSFDEEQKDNFLLFLPFYLDQFDLRTGLLKLSQGKVFEGLQQLREINDKQHGYNISGRNNPAFLMSLSQAYYRQNRFNEVVGIYFCLLKKFPHLKLNYELVKSIYATTTTASGETPR